MANNLVKLTDAQKQAIRWHSKINEIKSNSQVKQKFESWLASSSENKAAFEMIQFFWNDYAQLSSIGKSDLDQARSHAKKTQAINSRRKTSLVLVLLIIGVIVTNPDVGFRLASHHYLTAKGQISRLDLSDGSFIQMNTDSDIRVFDFLGTKKVWFERGEAWFDIHHDPESHFVVLTQQGKIKDIGTRFNVKADNIRTTVSVEEGEVVLESNQSQYVNVLEGQQAILDINGRLTRDAHADLTRILAWRSGILIFQNQTLSDVLEEISRYHQVEFTIQDSVLKHKRISGRFSTTNLPNTLHTLSEGMSLSIIQYQPAKFRIGKL